VVLWFIGGPTLFCRRTKFFSPAEENLSALAALSGITMQRYEFFKGKTNNWAINHLFGHLFFTLILQINREGWFWTFGLWTFGLFGVFKKHKPKNNYINNYNYLYS
jgi:hypothetical protein